VVDYLARLSLLWVTANAVASVLGAVAVLAAFDVSGGRDMLQFRYTGVVYSLVVGTAFLWMTRQARRAMSDPCTAKDQVAIPYGALSAGALGSGPGMPRPPSQSADNAVHACQPGVLEVHEHRVYRVHSPYRLPAEPTTGHGAALNTPGYSSEGGDNSKPDDGPDVIDTTYCVLP
jgi:hypothetical protein